MHSKKILTGFFYFVLCIGTTSVSAQIEYPILSIQESYRSGELSVNEATLAQLELFENSFAHSHSLNEPVKCATPLISFVEQNRHLLSEETMSAYQKAFSNQPIALTESYVSESGKFIIYYEVSGSNSVPLGDENSNSVPDYVEWVAEASDSSYRHEILTLGFKDPIPSGAQYSVTLRNLGAYGQARPVSSEPSGTVIEIENDFAGFPPNDDPEGHQKGAIKVTMAHEFKHAIQYAQSNWSGESDSWLEMDATLYEEIVYDNVNDYYNYLDGFASNFFGSPSSTLIPGSYEDITWALYFHDRFGDSFWTKVWERIEENVTITYLNAIEAELKADNVNFEYSVTEAMLWHFASGENLSNSSYGFDESSEYPNPTISETFTVLPDVLSDPNTLSRFSGRYFIVDLLETDLAQVQIDVLTDNSSLQLGLIAYNLDGTIDTQIITNPDVDVLNVNKTTFSWSEFDKLGLVFFNSSSSEQATFQFQTKEYSFSGSTTIVLSQNYPNPFNPITTIPVSLPTSQQIKLSIFDYLGREVQILRDQTLSAGVHNISFNASGLASGVYFSRLISEEGIQTKKMLLLK